MPSRCRSHRSPTCLADSEGRLQYANAAFLRLVGLEADQVASSSLRGFEVAKDGDATIRSAAIGSGGQLVRDGQWRRPDGSVFDVETTAAVAEGLEGVRVVTVRDVSNRNRAAQRAARDQRCTAGVLDLTQRAHSLTETRDPDARARTRRRSHRQPDDLRVPRAARGRAARAGGDPGRGRRRQPGSLGADALARRPARGHRVARMRRQPASGHARRRGGYRRAPASRLARVAAAATLRADARRRPPRRRAAARGQAAALRRRRCEARRAGRRGPVAGAATPPVRRGSRQRDGPHGTGDARRHRLAGGACGVAGRVQDGAREARGRPCGRHRHGARPARATACADCA